MHFFRDGTRVLVIDKEPSRSAVFASWFEDAGAKVQTCRDPNALAEQLTDAAPDVVCMDLDARGLRPALEVIRLRHPEVPLVVLTSDTSAETIVGAMRAGAFDCLPKPVARDRLLSSVENALDAQQEVEGAAIEPAPEEVSYAGIIGRSPEMREVFRRVDRIAGRDISVLIRGESGAGKELIARAIHENSRRAGGPYIAINCAAIPESLQDSELFGHERGSFTGAHKARAGCFERADGGTLFLDEVGELSLGVQAKLLRVLQERRFHRLGGVNAIDSDFRLVTATHRRLRELVEAGKFREDLYFRIVVFEIEVPPLRARSGDVRLLVPRLLEDVAASLGSGPVRVSARAMAALERYSYPGNVRELINILQSAAVLAADHEIRLADLPPQVRECWLDELDEKYTVEDASARHEPSPRSRRRATPTSLEEMPVELEDIERWAVKRALRASEGRVTEAAKALGIGRTTLYRKLEKYGLR